MNIFESEISSKIKEKSFYNYIKCITISNINNRANVLVHDKL